MIPISENEYFMLISHKTLISKEHIKRHKELLSSLAQLEQYNLEASLVMKEELIIFCKVLKTEKSISNKNIKIFQNIFIKNADDFIYDHKLDIESIRMCY
jgi:hypothetical protein